VLPISQQSIVVLSSLDHDYEGIALNEDEKPRLVHDLGDKNFFMLRNHGLLTVADNIPDVFLFMYVFEAACAIQVRAQAGGGELIPIDQRIIAGAKAQVKAVTRGAGGTLAWPGLLRKLDRLDPGYRAQPGPATAIRQARDFAAMRAHAGENRCEPTPRRPHAHPAAVDDRLHRRGGFEGREEAQLLHRPLGV
jgi:hypothetical protein